MFLLLGGIGAAGFLLWRRSRMQAQAEQDLWAPVETWPATEADRWPSTPAASSTPASPTTIVEPVAPEATAGSPEATPPKRAPRKRAES